MKVNHSTSNPVQGAEVSGAKAPAKGAAAAEAKKGGKPETAEGKTTIAGSVNAELSSKGRDMATAKAAATDAPDVREDKIAELKRRIAGGKYNVDSDAVADKMVDEHIHMAGIG